MNAVPASKRYRFGGFVLDIGARLMLNAGQRVALTPKEFGTLLALIEARGHAVGREQLMRSVWPETFVCDSSLARNISILRRRLGRESIETVARFGYRLTLPVVEDAVPSALLCMDPDSDTEHPSGAGEQDDLRAIMWGYLGMSYAQTGQYGRAAHAYEQAASLSVVKANYQAACAYAHAMNGQRDQAQKIIDALEKEASSGVCLPASAMVYAYIGLSNRQKAYVWLQRGLADGSTLLMEANTEAIHEALCAGAR